MACEGVSIAPDPESGAWVISVDDFRTYYPAFSDTSVYTNSVIMSAFRRGSVLLNPAGGSLLSGCDMALCLELVTAHILYIALDAQSGGSVGSGGGSTGVVTGATVGKVSVTNAAPPFGNGREYWYSKSEYGLMLWSILYGRSETGFYIGGSDERSGYRKVYGDF